MKKRIAKKIDNLVVAGCVGGVRRLLNYTDAQINEAWRIASRKKNKKWFLSGLEKAQRGEKRYNEFKVKFLAKIRRRPYLEVAQRYRRLSGQES